MYEPITGHIVDEQGKPIQRWREDDEAYWVSGDPVIRAITTPLKVTYKDKQWLSHNALRMWNAAHPAPQDVPVVH